MLRTLSIPFLLLVVARPAGSQETAVGEASNGWRASAIRASVAPAIDGLADDEVWRIAEPVTAFHQFEPDDEAPPSLSTEFRIAYDEKNVYVLVRAFDPAPDSILRGLARRDVRAPTDQITIFIDAQGDGTSGFEFGVNPDGVKRDNAIFDDDRRDGSWNGVWYVATTVDALGWTAEFRVPLSQLRYQEREEHEFGIIVFRDIERYRERVSWPALSRNRRGLASQAGTVGGVRGLSGALSLELSPYLVTRTEPRRTRSDGYERINAASAGADLRLKLSSSLTVDAAVNPDFGQVEADPAVLNLGAFESFFSERRPFFVEGAGQYRFDLNCYAVVDCNTNEGLFYSRRIGRSPALRAENGDASTPASTPVAAAVKLTGRLGEGFSFGVLEAVTRRVAGVAGETAEPRTNYLVMSAQQRFRGGAGDVQLLATGVNRDLDTSTVPHLHSSAYSAGATMRNRLAGGNYEVMTSVVASTVSGTEGAIARTQRSAVHYFQQPDADLDYDPTRTSLRGHAAHVRIGKYGGGITRFETSYVRQSAGFEVNDIGYLRRSGQQDWSTWASLRFNTPGRSYRWANFNANNWQTWTVGGLRLEQAVNVNGHVGLHNNWDLHAGGTIAGLGETYCDRCTWGGPAVRRSVWHHPWFGINGDSRRAVAPSLWVNLGFGDEGRSHTYSIRPELTLRPSGRWQLRVGANLASNVQAAQWTGNVPIEGGGERYTFAHLDQRTRSMTVRLNYTAGPDLTFEFYGEPFVSTGRFRDFRALSDTPRAEAFADRFVEYSSPALPTSFRVRQLRTNAVVRWEYRPGSALFLVWAHGRHGRDEAAEDRGWVGEYRDLLELRPEHTLLLKVSYWLDR